MLSAFAGFGIVNASLGKPGKTIQIPVVVRLEGVSYGGTLTLNYTAKQGSSGTAAAAK